MRRRLDEWMAATADPRSEKEETDEYPTSLRRESDKTVYS